MDQLNGIPSLSVIGAFSKKKNIESRDSVELKLLNGIYCPQVPLPEHKSKFKLELYNVIKPVYEGRRPVQDYFCCTRCNSLLQCDVGRNGTNQLARHFRNKTTKKCQPVVLENNDPSSPNTRDYLVGALKMLSELSATFGPLNDEDLKNSMPDNFETHENM